MRETERPGRSTLVLSGITCRYRNLENGKRQITAIHVPGDFVDLHSFLIKQMDHSVGTLSPCIVAYAPHEGLERITERLPHLARLLWLLTLIDASIHRQWLVTMGAYPALNRTAHLLCELFTRLTFDSGKMGVQPDPADHPAGPGRHAGAVDGAHQPGGAGAAGARPDPVAGPGDPDAQLGWAGRPGAVRPALPAPQPRAALAAERRP